jgi:hypothetical protein
MSKYHDSVLETRHEKSVAGYPQLGEIQISGPLSSVIFIIISFSFFFVIVTIAFLMAVVCIFILTNISVGVGFVKGVNLLTVKPPDKGAKCGRADIFKSVGLGLAFNEWAVECSFQDRGIMARIFWHM